MKPWKLAFAEHTWTDDITPAATLLVAEEIAGEGVDVSSPWNSLRARHAWLVALVAAQLNVDGMESDQALAAATALVFTMPQSEFLAALSLPDPDGQAVDLAVAHR